MGLVDDVAAARPRAPAAAERVSRAAENLSAARVRAESAGGDVTVVVDGTGALLEIQLAPPASRRHPCSLGARIVEAVTTARRQAVLDSQPALADLLGTEKAAELVGSALSEPAWQSTASRSPHSDTDAYFEGLDFHGLHR